MVDSYRPTRAYGPMRAVTTSTSVSSRTPFWAVRKNLMVIGLISALVAAAIVVIPVVASADSTTYNLVVNSAAWGGADASPGDGVCATSLGVCTLRAAIEESNALNKPAGQVSITVDPDQVPLGKMTGTIGTSTYMNSYTDANRVMNGGTNNVYFTVTAAVTVDLGHRLQVDGSADSSSYNAAFYLNASDIEVLNADQVMAGGASFVVGPQADNVTINGDADGACQQSSAPTYCGKIVTTTGNPRQFVVFRDGASNVLVTNYQVSGYSNSDANYPGIFVFDSMYPNYKPMSNIVVDSVQVINPQTRLTSFWNTTSPSNSNLGWSNSTASNTINGLTFTNMRVENLPGKYAFQFATSSSNTAAISDLVIENNVFLNSLGSGDGFITLPYGGQLTGTSSISNNVITSTGATTGNDYAIYYVGVQGANSTTPSGLTIANNYFNNYKDGVTVYNQAAGLVTVTGNTFGTGTDSQAATQGNGPAGTLAIAEEYSNSTVMYNANHGTTSSTRYSTNQSIRTWAPTAAASVLTGAAPDGTLVMDDPREGTMPTCPATVQVSQITATNNSADNYSSTPSSPVTLQAYWTGAKTAEVYLGQVTGVTGTSATLEVQLPVGPVTLPDGTATVVNATSGAAAGYIRLQTHVEGLAQLESSQYSRMVAVTGNCRPALTINQATGMNDPTYSRDLHFTLTSTVPLDPSTVTASDFTISATGVDQTIYPDDVSLLNARVVSIVPDPDSNNMSFDVIVRVDDSATVTVTVGANAVATDAKLSNDQAATYTDNSITFLNPLQVDPSSFTLVTGESSGKTFTISTVAGAPVPQADVMFVATVQQTAGATVSLSTTGPVMQANQTNTQPVTVTATGDVAANTPTPITLTVESSDTNYDGLVMPTVTPYLFSTDPAISVTKVAYTDVGDTSSTEKIIETGTLAPTGTRLMDGQTVCFVYTVTNISKDDWATSLTDIEVTDSDTRLGINGLIGVIQTLPDEETTQLSWCTSLKPVDTTIGN